MPTVFIFFGMRFLFYSNDHVPVHIHVMKGKGIVARYAKFSVLPKVELLENVGLKDAELKKAKAVIEDNKEIIVERWNEFFSDDKG